MNKIISLFISVLLFSFPAGAAETVQNDHTRASLISETTSMVPGQPLSVAVLLEAKEGWHTYWENPGDAGLATSFTWTLPTGFSASAIDWPSPEIIREGPLAVYGYTGTVLLPATITLPEKLDASASYPIKVKADWLVCNNICVPESAELTLDLPVKNTAAFSDRAIFFEHHRQLHSIPLEQPVVYTNDAGHITLFVPLKSMGLERVRNAVFIARQPGLIKYTGEQTFSVENNVLQLTMETSGEIPEGTLGGILSVNNQEQYFDITLAQSLLPTQAKQHQALPIILLLAILGGLILNLMPCVLPVLSLKALAVVKKSGHEHYHVVRQGMAYTLGILVSFGLLAGLLISLQHGGQSIGWGYQMQSPVFVGFLIYLLFLVGVNLSGGFHLPVVLGNVGSRMLADESSLKASFLTGVLATAVATPCTAPFMASAVGVALLLPSWQAMLVFEFLGLGLALPFLLISIFPQALRFLPKPGAWMNTFKEILAFPMYASVIWLLWVLDMQTGAGGVAMVLSGMLLIIFIIWLRPHVKDELYRTVSLTLLAFMFAFTLPTLSRMHITSAMPEMQDVGTVAFSKEKLASLRAMGKPVFVDATAAWCITCQVNGRALHSERVMQAFRDHGVTLMVADWTLRNDSITEFLREFGYNGVPLYVFYPAKGAPKLLPQILSESTVIDAITSP